MKNNWKTRIKILIDIIMFIVFVLLMNLKVTGMNIHEIIGIAILAVVVIHTILNYNWIKGILKKIFKKNLPIKTRIKFILDIVLIIGITADVIIGILISQTILTNITVGNYSTLSEIHHWISYWLLILISVHLGLNLDQILNICNNALKKIKVNIQNSIIVKILLKIFYVIIAIAGIVSLAKPDINKNFILNFEKNKNQNGNQKTETTSEKQESDSQEQTTNTTNSSTVVVEEVSNIEEYLGKLFCTGCGRHCPLTNPQCGTGMTRQTEEIANYNEMYGTNETYTSTRNNTNTSNNTEVNTDTENRKDRKYKNSTNLPDISNRSETRQKTETSVKLNYNKEETKNKNQENNKEQEATISVMDYVWIMGLVIGGTHYVVKIPKTIKKIKNKENKKEEKKEEKEEK